MSKFDVIKEFLDRYNERIDVIVIGETWIKKGCQDMYVLNGYKGYFSCRPTSHGGLAMYVKDDLHCNKIEIKYTEGLHVIDADIQACGRSINVFAVYRPSGYQFPRFLDVIDEKLSGVNKEQHI